MPRLSTPSLDNATKADYNLLVDALKARFRTQDRERFIRQQCESLQQTADQTVLDYSVALNSFAETALAYITDQDQRDISLRERFIAGIQPHIREQLILMAPATYSDALTAANRVESAKLVKPVSEPASVATVLEKLISRIDLLSTPGAQASVAPQKPVVASVAEAPKCEGHVPPDWFKPYLMALSNDQRRPGNGRQRSEQDGKSTFMNGRQSFTPAGRSLCYSCGKPGHRARECRNKFCSYHQQPGHTTRECRAAAATQSQTQPMRFPNQGYTRVPFLPQQTPYGGISYSPQLGSPPRFAGGPVIQNASGRPQALAILVDPSAVSQGAGAMPTNGIPAIQAVGLGDQYAANGLNGNQVNAASAIDESLTPFVRNLMASGNFEMSLTAGIMTSPCAPHDEDGDTAVLPTIGMLTLVSDDSEDDGEEEDPWRIDMTPLYQKPTEPVRSQTLTGTTASCLEEKSPINSEANPKVASGALNSDMIKYDFNGDKGQQESLAEPTEAEAPHSGRDDSEEGEILASKETVCPQASGAPEQLPTIEQLNPILDSPKFGYKASFARGTKQRKIAEKEQNGENRNAGSHNMGSWNDLKVTADECVVTASGRQHQPRAKKRRKPHRGGQHKRLLSWCRSNGSAHKQWSSPPLWMMCLFTIMATPALALNFPNPLICQTGQNSQIFRLPSKAKCKQSESSTSVLSRADIQLYKRNLVQYKTAAWLCTKVTQSVDTFTYFFADEHLKQPKTEAVLVDGAECDEIVKYKKCNAGPLAIQGNIWATGNKLKWSFPGGGWYCCKCKHFQATNCYLQKAFVYKRHGTPVMESTAGDVSHCEYKQGYCAMEDKGFLKWKINATEQCEFLKWQIMTGTLRDKEWLGDKGTLALTFHSGEAAHDCLGNGIGFSDQGIPYRILRKTKMQLQTAKSHIKYAQRKVTNRINRVKREDTGNPVGVVTSELLAASLQALEVDTKRAINFSFQHLVAAACVSMNNVLEYLHALMVGDPTLAMRNALDRSNLYAQAGGTAIEVWPCTPLPNRWFRFLPMNASCFEYLPIAYTWDNNTRTGYMDPKTNVVHHGLPRQIDCNLVGQKPLTLQNVSYVYDPATGKIAEPANIITLHQFKFNSSLSQLPSVIFHPIVMYHLDEIASHVSLNELLGGLSRQNQVLKLMGMQTDASSPKQAASRTAATIVSNGIFGFLRGLAVDFKQVWIFVCCCYVTASLLFKLCCNYACLAAKLQSAKAKLSQQVEGVARTYRYMRTPELTLLPTTLQAQSKLASKATTVDADTAHPRPAQRGAVEFQPYTLNCNIHLGGRQDGTVVRVKVDGIPMTALLDTGAPISVMARDAVNRLPKIGNKTAQERTVKKVMKALSASGDILLLNGTIKTQLQIGKVKLQGSFAVADKLPYDLLMGRNVLKDMGTILLDIENNVVTVGGEPLRIGTPSSGQAAGATPGVHFIRLSESQTVPSRSECILDGAVALEDGKVYMIEPLDAIQTVRVASAVVTPKDGKIPLRVLNPSTSDAKIYSGTRLARISPLSATEIERIEAQEQTQPEATASNTDQILNQIGREPKFRELNLSSSVLDNQNKCELLKILYAFRDIFAAGDHDLGCTSLVEHQIHTGGAAAIRSAPYRTAFSNREVIRQKIGELLENKIIQPSSSEWASPIVLVKKRDNSWRMCVDYRKLNKVTTRDGYPIKRMDDVLASLGKAQIYSTLDLQSGYHQVAVDPNDRPKTAFISYEGLYEYCKMPFGLSNAPATFQRLMERVLAGLDWKTFLVYLDDILILGPTPEIHNQRLRQVFHRLRAAGLKLKLKKCAFGQSSVGFLGHILTSEGLLPESAKVDKIQSWPRPQTAEHIASFLGLCGYYRDFVPGFSKVAEPLHALTHSGKKFQWDANCENAFRELKVRLTSAPVLVFPDFNKPLVLQTDASNASLGAVLSQVQDDGKDHPIAYASRLLNKAERNYATVEKEALAVVFAVNHFRPFIYGQEVVVVTDHKPLVWLFSFKNPDGRLMRWSLALQAYNLKIVHRSGKQNGNADALSRRPPQLAANAINSDAQCRTCNELMQDKAALVATLEAPEQIADLGDEQRNDAKLKALIEYLETGAACSEDPQNLVKHAEDFVLEGDVLYRTEGPGTLRKRGRKIVQLVLPQARYHDALYATHDHAFGGHLGIRKTHAKLTMRYWWPTCHKDVMSRCQRCETCARRKPPGKRYKPPLHSIAVGGPWEKVGLDVLGNLPTTPAGNKCIVVMMDYFTKWPECVATPDTKATTLAKIFVKTIVCRHGTPKELLTDQGRNMIASTMSEMCRLLNIQKLKTAVYHPATDGLVERFNRPLEAMLASYVSDGQTDWDEMLPYAMFAYRTASQESTGESPFFLNYGRDPVLPLDLELRAVTAQPKTPDDHKFDLAMKLQQAWQLASKAIGKAQQRQKNQHDTRLKFHTILPNDRVYMYVPQIGAGKSMKLAKPWRGPYRVMRVSEDGTGCEIVRIDKPGRQGIFRANVRNLKLGPKETQFVDLEPANPLQDADADASMQPIGHNLGNDGEPSETNCPTRDQPDSHKTKEPCPATATTGRETMVPSSRYNLRSRAKQPAEQDNGEAMTCAL